MKISAEGQLPDLPSRIWNLDLPFHQAENSLRIFLCQLFPYLKHELVVPVDQELAVVIAEFSPAIKQGLVNVEGEEALRQGGDKLSSGFLCPRTFECVADKTEAGVDYPLLILDLLSKKTMPLRDTRESGEVTFLKLFRLCHRDPDLPGYGVGGAEVVRGVLNTLENIPKALPFVGCVVFAKLPALFRVFPWPLEGRETHLRYKGVSVPRAFVSIDVTFVSGHVAYNMALCRFHIATDEDEAWVGYEAGSAGLWYLVQRNSVSSHPLYLIQVSMFPIQFNSFFVIGFCCLFC